MKIIRSQSGQFHFKLGKPFRLIAITGFSWDSVHFKGELINSFWTIDNRAETDKRFAVAYVVEEVLSVNFYKVEISEYRNIVLSAHPPYGFQKSLCNMLVLSSQRVPKQSFQVYPELQIVTQDFGKGIRAACAVDESSQSSEQKAIVKKVPNVDMKTLLTDAINGIE